LGHGALADSLSKAHTVGLEGQVSSAIQNYDEKKGRRMIKLDCRWLVPGRRFLESA